MQPLVVENTVTIPAFLGKLWKMVNDPETDHLISWGPAGNSFIIQNQSQFWYELLPLYYKHNNMSSFVRQLNMYGFHKISTVENGSMDADKDEIQFTHPFFQKDQPELLKLIKRKVTTAKVVIESGTRHDELTRVLADVKQLRGRQANVDSQLHAMKQENALLWREVAILRTKHIKQQKIVNKLIQFLVTLVQPSRLAMGVKRGYQLMLHESPTKKMKQKDSSSNTESGPTIHELDNEIELDPDLYEGEVPLIDSPVAPAASQQAEVSSPLQIVTDENGDSNRQWDKPEFVSIGGLASSPSDLIDNDELIEENLMNTLESNAMNGGTVNARKIFLNPTTQDTLLSNLIKCNSSNNSSSSSSSSSSKKINKKQPLVLKTEGFPVVASNVISSTPAVESKNMTVATRDTNLCDIRSVSTGTGTSNTSDSYSEDLSNHVESTQSELEQFKDILNGYNSFVDANALLGLFHEDSPPPECNVNLNDTAAVEDKSENHPTETSELNDPLVSESELAPYAAAFDFTELFDDSSDGANPSAPSHALAVDSLASTVNTPQIVSNEHEPIFPAITRK